MGPVRTGYKYRMRSDDEMGREEPFAATAKDAERGIATARAAGARSEEGQSIFITENCSVRFSRWFEEPEK